MNFFRGFVFAMSTAAIALGQSPKAIPVVIELFTSEGCSSCPPADRLLAAIDKEQPIPGAQLIVMSEHVDYWNSEGWVDPYSSHEFSERQVRYGDALRVPDPYTPQAVVDGRYEAVGNSGAKLEDAIQRAMREKKVPLQLQVSRSDKGIHVELHSDESLKHGEVLFAVAEDSVESTVSAGENGGRKLAHTAVVRSLTKGGKLAKAGDSGIVMDLKTNPRWGTHLRVIALVSDYEGGKIFGAAMAQL